MVDEPKMQERDIDDIHCRMLILSHLKGMQGEELGEMIASREALLRETLGRCGLPVLTSRELIEGTESENIGEE